MILLKVFTLLTILYSFTIAQNKTLSKSIYSEGNFKLLQPEKAPEIIYGDLVSLIALTRSVSKGTVQFETDSFTIKAKLSDIQLELKDPTEISKLINFSQNFQKTFDENNNSTKTNIAGKPENDFTISTTEKNTLTAQRVDPKVATSKISRRGTVSVEEGNFIGKELDNPESDRETDSINKDQEILKRMGNAIPSTSELAEDLLTNITKTAYKAAIVTYCENPNNCYDINTITGKKVTDKEDKPYGEGESVFRENKENSQEGSVDTDNDNKYSKELSALKEFLIKEEAKLNSKLFFTGELVRKFKIDGVVYFCYYKNEGMGEEEFIKITCETLEARSKRTKTDGKALALLDERTYRFYNEVESFAPSRFVRSLLQMEEPAGPIRMNLSESLVQRNKRYINTKGLIIDDQNFAENLINRLTISSVSCANKPKEFILEGSKCIQAANYISSLENCFWKKSCKMDESLDNKGDCVSSKCTQSFIIVPSHTECSTDETGVVKQYTSYNSFGDHDFCSVEVGGEFKEIKKCKEFTTVRKEVVFTITPDSAGMLKPLIEPFIKKENILDNIENYDCDKSCESIPCNGDSNYLHHFQYDVRSETYCAYNPDKYVLILQQNMEKLYLNCITKKFVNVRIEKKAETPLSINDEDLSCAKGVLKLKNASPDIHKIVLTSEKDILLLNDPEVNDLNTISESLPPSLVIPSRNLSIKIFSRKTSKPYETMKLCSVRNSCELVSCHFCYERWINITCLSAIEWVLLIITLVLTLLILKVLISFIFSFRVVRKLGSKMSKLILIRSLMKMKKTNNEELPLYNKKKPKSNNTDQEEVVYKETTALRRNVSPKKSSTIHYPRRSFFSVCLVFLFFCPINKQEASASLIEECSETRTVMLSGNMCTGTDSTNCVLKTFVELNVGSSMSATCLIFNDKSFKSRVLSIIKIDEIYYECEKNSLYYTYSSSLDFSSYKICGGTEPCKTKGCEISEDEIIHTTSMENKTLGKTVCASTCGCWGCGCFVCTSACTYGRFNLINKNSKSYEVFSCSDFSLKIRIDFRAYLEGELIDQGKLLISPDSSVNTQYFEMFIKDYSISNPLTTTDCFVQDGQEVFMRHCNQRDEYMKGRIGEIQCKTKADAALGDSKGCKFAREMVKYNLADGQSSAKLDQVTISEEIYRLPQKIGGGLVMTERDNKIIYKPERNILTTLSLKVKGIVIGVIEKVSKCMVDSTSLEGCYSCQRGSTLMIKARALDAVSSGYISCPSAVSPAPILVPTVLVEQKISLTFDKEQIEEDCVLVCSGGNVSFTLSGKLVYVPTKFIQKTSTVFVGNNEAGEAANISGFFKIPWISTTIIIIVVLLLIVIVAPLFIKGIKLYYSRFKIL